MMDAWRVAACLQGLALVFKGTLCLRIDGRRERTSQPLQLIQLLRGAGRIPGAPGRARKHKAGWMTLVEDENALRVLLVEDDAREAREAVVEWGDKASAASRRADQLRAEANTTEADRFDDLARLERGRLQHGAGEGRGDQLDHRVEVGAELSVGVEPDWRGRGVGTRLVGALLADARAAGISTSTTGSISPAFRPRTTSEST